MGEPVLIRAVSDLHGKLPTVEPSDVLVIAGDVCPHGPGCIGSPAECAHQARWLNTTFRRWLDDLPAKDVVATWGNHDHVGQRHPRSVPPGLRWTLLVDAGATVAGLRLWG